MIGLSIDWLKAIGRVGPQFGAQVEVTPQMRDAGGQALRNECQDRFGTSWCNDVSWDFAEVAYRAMAVLAPVPLVTEAEDRIAALTKERDEAFACARRNIDAATVACDDLAKWENENDALRAEIATLHDLLADRTNQRDALKPAPEPSKPNPFREFTTDRRRIGG